VKCGLAWRSRQYEGVDAIDGINIGAAGVILGLASIDRASGYSEFSKDIQGGARWLASQKPNEAAHGFFTGNAGVAVALGVAGRRFGCPEWISEARSRLRQAVTVEGDCDLFSGKAGVLWAACLLGEILEDFSWCEPAANCGESLISSPRSAMAFGCGPHPTQITLL